jgi:hypothetical protein
MTSTRPSRLTTTIADPPAWTGRTPESLLRFRSLQLAARSASLGFGKPFN